MKKVLNCTHPYPVAQQLCKNQYRSFGKVLASLLIIILTLSNLYSQPVSCSNPNGIKGTITKGSVTTQMYNLIQDVVLVCPSDVIDFQLDANCSFTSYSNATWQIIDKATTNVLYTNTTLSDIIIPTNFTPLNDHTYTIAFSCTLGSQAYTVKRDFAYVDNLPVILSIDRTKSGQYPPGSPTGDECNSVCINLQYPDYFVNDKTQLPDQGFYWTNSFPGTEYGDWGDINSGSMNNIHLASIKQLADHAGRIIYNTNVCHMYSSTGSQTISVTYDFCGKTITKTLDVYVGPADATITTSAQGFCPGNTTPINITVPSHEGFTYQWSNGATTNSINPTPNATSTYSVTVTSASGCTATATTTIEAYPNCCTGNPIYDINMTDANLSDYITHHMSMFQQVNGVWTFKNNVAVYINGALKVNIPFNFNPNPANQFAITMGANASIVIAPNAGYSASNPMPVIFDNCVLEPCGAYWTGIIHKDGFAKVNIQHNTQVIKAFTGCDIANSAAFYVNNSTFQDCYTGMKITNSTFNANNSSIEGTTFDATTLRGYYAQGTHGVAKTDRIIGIDIASVNYDPTTSNFAIGPPTSLSNPNINHFAHLLTGININASNVSVLGNEFSQIKQVCNYPTGPCTRIYPYNGCGVYAADNFWGFFGTPHQLYISTYPNIAPTTYRFSNCDYGVRTTLYRPTIEYNPMNTVNIGIDVSTVIFGTTAIHHNWITGTNGGINVNGSIFGDVNVTENNITANVPTIQFGTGFSYSSPFCISLSNLGSPFSAYNPIPPTSTGSHIAGNTLVDGLSGIWINGCSDKSLVISDWNIPGNAIGHNTISFPTILSNFVWNKIGGHIFGIRAESSSGYSISANEISGQSITHGYGISNYQTQDYRICGNTLSNMYADLRFYDYCPTAPQGIRMNYCANTTCGLLLDKNSYNVGYVGSTIGLASAGGGYGLHNYNHFYNQTSATYYDTYNNTTNFPIHTAPIYYYTANTPPSVYPQRNNSLPVGKSISAIPSPTCDATICNGSNCGVFNKRGIDAYESWMIAAADDNLSFPLFSEGTVWAKKKQLYAQLADDAELRNSNDTLSAFYTAYATQDIGMIVACERLRDSIYNDTAMLEPIHSTQRLLDLKMAINAIPASAEFGANDKAMEFIYLSILHDGAEVAFDSATTQLVSDLAIQCPYLRGTAVYKARSLYNYIEPGLHTDDKVLCCCDEMSYKKKPNPEDIVIDNYPIAVSAQDALLAEMERAELLHNPVTDQIEISYHQFPTGTAGSLGLFDISGRQIQMVTFSMPESTVDMNVSGLANGMYIAKLSSTNGWSRSFKIIIEK